MTVGVHPAITFDKPLAVGQEVQVRFATEGRSIRLLDRDRPQRLARTLARANVTTS